MNGHSVNEAVSQFESLCAELPERLQSDQALNDSQRLAALSAARKAVRNLQTPTEYATEQTWAPLELVGVAVGIDLGIFRIVAESEGPVSLATIQSKAPGDKLLVYRIVRFLAAHQLLDQVSQDEYTANVRTRDYATEVREAVAHKQLFCLPAFAAIPYFLRKTEWNNPTDPKNCPWQLGLHTEETFWEWIKARPEMDNYFNVSMNTARSRFNDELARTYPFEKLLEGSQPEDVIFVDVGGGHGHQSVNIRNSFPRQRGRVVLQDLENVVKGKQLEDVEVQTHNMFDEQPIKGAKAYYFRGVCHDHSDAYCRKFLNQVRQAMSPDSRLLVHERYVDDRNPAELITKADLIMMAEFAAQERSPRQMTELLESSGFKVVGLHQSGTNEWKIMEAMLP